MQTKETNLEGSQAEIIRNTLRSILDSPQFAKSKRYPAFLEYVVLGTLEGNDFALKERVLATEVFGRPADYDSSSDTVVRVAAGEVRRRLAQYFNEHPDAPVRIDLPIGTYAAEFHFAPTLLSGNSPEKAQLLADPAGDNGQISESPDAARQSAPGTSRVAFVTVGLLIMLVAGITIWVLRGADPAQRFWQSLLSNGQPAMILPGKIPNYTPGTGVGQQLASNPNFYARSVLSLEDAIVIARVCSVFREYNHDCNISEASTVSLENITGKSLVVIGAFNNVWVPKLMASLPYQLEYFPGSPSSPTGTRTIVEHKSNGDTPMWTTREGATGSQSVLDYVLIARFHSSISDSTVVTIGGLHPASTFSGADYLFSPEKMKQLISMAPKSWKGENFEAVLQIEVMADSPGRPTVVAAKFW